MSVSGFARWQARAKRKWRRGSRSGGGAAYRCIGQLCCPVVALFDAKTWSSIPPNVSVGVGGRGGVKALLDFDSDSDDSNDGGEAQVKGSEKGESDWT